MDEKQDMKEEVIQETTAREEQEPVVETAEEYVKTQTNNELEEKNQKIEELQTRLLRLQADFDNFRRRTAKEQSELASFVTADVVKKFIGVVDSFERAEASMEKADNVESMKVGLDMIKRQLTQCLKDLSVEEIEAQGIKFDPVFHEAVMRGNNPELEDETIEAVFEKGYKLHDKVIRHSKVKVITND